MPRATTSVRDYQRADGTKVSAHRRRFTFQPRRALHNARTANRHWARDHHARAVLFGTTALLELTGFVVFKSVGGLLAAVGLFTLALGLAMGRRT
jgi:hypothetical protein